MDMPAAERDAIGLLGRERVCARWSWERIADRLISGVPHNERGGLSPSHDHTRRRLGYRAARMGESPKITDPLAALEQARVQFEQAEDFTIAVEEEFAILDPATLEMTPGFERLAAAAARARRRWRGMVAGELIRQRGRGQDRQVRDLRRSGRRDGPAADRPARRGRRRWASACAPPAPIRASRWQDQQVIDTPHYHDRRVDAALRGLAQQHLRPARPRRHPRRRPRDRRQPRASLGAARAARAVQQLALAGGPPHAPALDPHRDLHQVLPPLRHPRRLRRLGSSTPSSSASWSTRARSASTPRSGGACAHTRPIPTVETRICDGQPEFARSVALAGLMVALTADFARRFDAGEPLPDHPGRDLEENMWRAIRWGMAGELIDLAARRSMPAAERIERLLDQCRRHRRRPGHRPVPAAAARADAVAAAGRADGGWRRPARAVAGRGRPQRSGRRGVAAGGGRRSDERTGPVRRRARADADRAGGDAVDARSC